jgi:hypothetical protein
MFEYHVIRNGKFKLIYFGVQEPIVIALELQYILYCVDICLKNNVLFINDM